MHSEEAHHSLTLRKNKVNMERTVKTNTEPPTKKRRRKEWKPSSTGALKTDGNNALSMMSLKTKTCGRPNNEILQP